MLALFLHSSETRKPRHDVRASASRIVGSDLMSIRFEIDGTQNIIWPVDSNDLAGRRIDELWKQTCLECFVGGSKHVRVTSYREWNFSANRDWAAYSFRDYREGMSKPEVSAPSIKKKSVGEVNRFEIDFALSNENLSETICLGLTAVILEKGDAAPYFWALAHVGAKPDFHLRESFTLELES